MGFQNTQIIYTSTQKKNLPKAFKRRVELSNKSPTFNSLSLMHPTFPTSKMPPRENERIHLKPPPLTKIAPQPTPHYNRREKLSHSGRTCVRVWIDCMATLRGYIPESFYPTPPLLQRVFRSNVFFADLQR